MTSDGYEEVVVLWIGIADERKMTFGMIYECLHSQLQGTSFGFNGAAGAIPVVVRSWCGLPLTEGGLAAIV